MKTRPGSTDKVVRLLGHVADQVHAAVGIAPLVVIPAHEFEEAAVQLDAAARIEKALAKRTGVSARVTVLTAVELTAAMTENPLLEVASDRSRLLVAFLRDPSDRRKLEPLTKQNWAPETLAIGTRVAYLWCPEGILASRLAEAVNRALGDAVTARNWATVLKLHALTVDNPGG